MERKSLVLSNGGLEQIQDEDHLEGTLVDGKMITPLTSLTSIDSTDLILLVRNGKPYTIPQEYIHIPQSKNITGVIFEDDENIVLENDIEIATLPFDSVVEQVTAKTTSGTATVAFYNGDSIISTVDATDTGVDTVLLENETVAKWNNLSINVTNPDGIGLVINIKIKEL